MDTDTRADLVRLRRDLVDLADWAAHRLDDEYDRQYIAEHLTDSLIALLAGTTLPVAPF
jgi:hypothetical protein